MDLTHIGDAAAFPDSCWRRYVRVVGRLKEKQRKHQPVITVDAVAPHQPSLQTFDVPDAQNKNLMEHEAAERQIYLLKDARVVTLHLGLEAGGGFKFRELGGVPTDVTGHLAAGWSGAHTGQISLSVGQTLQRNTPPP